MDDNTASIRKASQYSLTWQWNEQNKDVELDKTQFSKVFLSRLPYVEEKFLLSALSLESQADFYRCMENCKAKNKATTYCCTLLLEKERVCYAEFVMKPPVNGNPLTGLLYPLFFFPSSGHDIGTLFHQVFENQHHGIVITDSEHHILVSNDHFATNTGYAKKQLVGQPASILNSGKHSPEFYQALWASVQSQGYWTGTILIRKAGGQIVPQELTVQRISVRNRVFYMGWYVDLSDHLYRVEDVEHGGVELLTQLPTESQFIERLVSRWLDSKDKTLSMVVAFLPKFPPDLEFDAKAKLSEQLASGRHAHVAGYLGNNHFVVYLECEKVIGPSQTRLIHQAIRRFFLTLNRQAGQVVHDAILSGKVGVSVMEHDTQNPKLLVPHAVQAMLEQSNERKGMITFYHGTIHREVLRRKGLEDLVIKAIKERKIEVFYQPIVDTKTWDVAKFEALCRFKDAKGRYLNTQEMVSIAEDLDLVADLDWCVGRKSIEGLEKIHKRFGNKLGLTINRSLNTKLGAEKVLHSAEKMITSYSSTPELITLELTESAYFDSESSQELLIKSIRDHGVSVAIDDFGTGYSSFTYLSDCNFDLLKIDREFVTEIKVGTHKYHIVKSITDLSHTLDVKVVAEGVETRQELEVLCGIGVDYIQGYFFSKPLPIGELEHAWDYQAQLEDFLSRKSSVLSIGVLNICRSHAPSLSPENTIKEAKEYFDSRSFNINVIPIVYDNRCVGVIDRETINLYLSPTAGSKLETTKDLSIWKKTLNTIMCTDIYRVTFNTKVSEIPDMVASGIMTPWIVEDELGQYLGLVTDQDLLSHFAIR
ncbi:EAL domain-containing protein [Vibrio sp. S4M6]|uniref:EAL domain-containing protein n=1 Tax=Vibrio sinus TaxID=2946865 RepID=UPI00202A784D|nr:EAL domain-containing protein [Vibrio sinus]MCL9782753.1 EAL domain-containing protein [Vibrio sinus]